MATRPLLLLAVLLGGLLALKSLSLVDEAASLFSERAYAAAMTAAPEQDAEPDEDEDAAEEEDPGPPPPPLSEAGPREIPSASRLGLERNLAVRRRELDNRERDLDTRELLLAVAQSRVDERIDQLETLRDEVQGLLGVLDDRREEQITDIVATYNSMEPEAVAPIFTAMRESDPETLLLVAERLPSRRLATIMGEMEPADAAELTSNLRARAEAFEDTVEAEARRALAEG